MSTFDPKAAGDAAEALFPNSGLHRYAREMAACHPYALDYIRQAPVIVLASNGGRTGHGGARGFSAGDMRYAIEHGRRLRNVMRIFGCGYHLRRLSPSVLHPNRWDLIRHIGRFDPLHAAQAIPETSREQRAWLEAIGWWVSQMRQRRMPVWHGMDWAIWGLRGCGGKEGRVAADLADFYVYGAGTMPNTVPLPDPVPFQASWTFAQARAAQERWHAALARLKADHSAFEAYGYAEGVPVPYAPLPEEAWAYKGLELHPLRTADAIYEEGAAMHHCAATYADDVAAGRMFLYSLRQGDRRLATVRIAPLLRIGRGFTGARPFEIREIAGVCNSTALKPWIQAAKAMVIEVNQREADRDAVKLERDIAAVGQLRQVFPDVGGRFSDEIVARPNE